MAWFAAGGPRRREQALVGPGGDGVRNVVLEDGAPTNQGCVDAHTRLLRRAGAADQRRDAERTDRPVVVVEGRALAGRWCSSSRFWSGAGVGAVGCMLMLLICSGAAVTPVPSVLELRVHRTGHGEEVAGPDRMLLDVEAGRSSTR